MYNAHYQRGRIHTNEHLLLFLPWGKEIYQISIVPKQVLINAFYLCLQTDYSDCVAKVQQNLRICKKNRILVRFFTRRVIAEHKTSGG
jgi:hypothetical protein